MADERPDFAEDPKPEAPVPVEAAGELGNYCDDRSKIPEEFFRDEHRAKVGDWHVLRSGWDCPRCGSDVFFHPLSIGPHNVVRCFNCQYSPFGIVWWETPRLEDIAPASDS